MIPSKSKRETVATIYIAVILAFLCGCFLSTTFVLNWVVHQNDKADVDCCNHDHDGPSQYQRVISMNDPILEYRKDDPVTGKVSSSSSPLQGIRILIAIAAYDFSQIPHLEEVIDAYQGLCVTGTTKVDVVIHATVAYPVTLIDLWNTRLLPSCQKIFSLQIILKPSTLRLHLVDCHRELFYSKLDQYDLFVYTEDDIRVTPATVAAYWSETKRIQHLVGMERSKNYNVGIVRYEYNWPNNVIIDDKTRHATQNVTRVYWEHGRVCMRGV
jgi:hypothetical protein